MQPDDFVLDPDWMEKTECEVATLSEMLKKVFGWSARMATGDGIGEFIIYGVRTCSPQHLGWHPQLHGH